MKDKDVEYYSTWVLLIAVMSMIADKGGQSSYACWQFSGSTSIETESLPKKFNA